MRALTTLIRRKATVASPPPPAAPATATEISPLDSTLAKAILQSLDDAKAEEISAVDLRGKTTIADALVVASGRSSVHVGAIAERVVKACKECGVAAPRVEGLQACDWVLVDARDVIVHIFRPEVRRFYNLEKLWSGDRPAESGARDKKAG